MKNHIKGFSNYLNESKSISQLDPREEQPMIKGIAQILRGVRDKRNRRELAERQVKGFKKEGIRFDYAEFFKLCGLDK